MQKFNYDTAPSSKPKQICIMGHVRLVLAIISFVVSSSALIDVSVLQRLSTNPPVTIVVNLADKIGSVRGRLERAPNGKQVAEFSGIPFAEPPIGTQRFKPPVEKKPWNGIFNATEIPAACYQLGYPGDQRLVKYWLTSDLLSRMTEDCLQLNVWAPAPNGGLTPGSKLPVMVWIHGGGFYAGWSFVPYYNGQILASEENVILVSMNYRVSILGFLYSNSSDAPGNVGLLDQLLALKWVSKHISRFGGDPNSVTIFGESAGAASAGYHAISPLSAPYFNRVIMESGAPISPWALNSNAQMVDYTLGVAAKVGCLNTASQNQNAATVVGCLSRVPAQTLTDNSMFAVEVFKLVWTPVVDAYFLPQAPDQILKSGNFKKADILAGSNLNEAYMFFPLMVAEIFPPKLVYQTSDIITSDRMMYDALGKMLYKKYNTTLLKDAIFFEYYNWTMPATALNREQSLEKVLSDQHFTCPTQDFLATFAQANQSSAYEYRFVYHADQNSTPDWMNAVHTDEIPFVFGAPLNTKLYNYTAKEKALSRRMMRYWTNFARTGNPNLNPNTDPNVLLINPSKIDSWLQYGVNENYLKIRLNTAKSKTSLRKKQCKFWSTFLPELMAAVGA